MNTVTLDGYVLFALLTVVTIGAIYPAGRIGARRGRGFKNWAWIAAAIGPPALALLLLLPNLHGSDGEPAA